MSEKLNDEGITRVIVQKRTRHVCEICGEPAEYKHTFLLDGGRHNPLSSAYGKDDCSWCEDASRFVCAEHKNKRFAPDGYITCSTFQAVDHLAHLFLYWKEQ